MMTAKTAIMLKKIINIQHSLPYDLFFLYLHYIGCGSAIQNQEQSFCFCNAFAFHYIREMKNRTIKNKKVGIMLNKKVEEALNAQINAEMWSAYLYLSMAAYCHAEGQPGMAKWFEVQFQEEQDHAKILFNYINSRNGRVELKAIDEVPTNGTLFSMCSRAR